MTVRSYRMTFAFNPCSECRDKTVDVWLYRAQRDFVCKEFRWGKVLAGVDESLYPLLDHFEVAKDGCTLLQWPSRVRVVPFGWRTAWDALELPAKERFEGNRALRIQEEIQAYIDEDLKRHRGQRGPQKADLQEREQLYALILVTSVYSRLRTAIRHALTTTPADQLPRLIRQRLADAREPSLIPALLKDRMRDLVSDIASAIRKATKASM